MVTMIEGKSLLTCAKDEQGSKITKIVHHGSTTTSNDDNDDEVDLYSLVHQNQLMKMLWDSSSSYHTQKTAAESDSDNDDDNDEEFHPTIITAADNDECHNIDDDEENTSITTSSSSSSTRHTSSSLKSINERQQQQQSCSEPSSSSSSLPLVEQCVQFSGAVRVRFVESRSVYSSKERRNCWFTDKEINKINRQRVKTIARMNSGKPEKDDSHIYRGLEEWDVKRTIGRSVPQSQRILAAVMDEQDRQWKENIFPTDEDRIARASRRVSIGDIAIALRNARQDEQEARMYMEEVDSSSSSSCHQSAKSNDTTTTRMDRSNTSSTKRSIFSIGKKSYSRRNNNNNNNKEEQRAAKEKKYEETINELCRLERDCHVLQNDDDAALFSDSFRHLISDLEAVSKDFSLIQVSDVRIIQRKW